MIIQTQIGRRKNIRGWSDRPYQVSMEVVDKAGYPTKYIFHQEEDVPSYVSWKGEKSYLIETFESLEDARHWTNGVLYEIEVLLKEYDERRATVEPILTRYRWDPESKRFLQS